jgi:hypothetical protein
LEYLQGVTTPFEDTGVTQRYRTDEVIVTWRGAGKDDKPQECVQ